jgi:hypothetical protein
VTSSPTTAVVEFVSTLTSSAVDAGVEVSVGDGVFV